MKTPPLTEYYATALVHKVEHNCGGVPYQNGELLSTLSAATKPKRVLELGTGIGYSTACLALGYKNAAIETIDQDESHIKDARRHWEKLDIADRITTFTDKAEAVLPKLQESYDLIFFDGYAPSMKFLIHFERLLKKGGLLITANLYLKDPKGGAYFRHLTRGRSWHTAVISDTALSVKEK